MFKKTKIVATIGPSSNHPHIISKLIQKGMNVARLNMAHQIDEKEISSLVNSIREEAKKHNTHVGILMDIAGPKVRVDLSNIGHENIEIIKGHVYTLGYSKMNDIPINMNVDFKDLRGRNASVLIDDGSITFKVLSIKNNILKLKASEDGNVINNKGVNFPGLELEIPSITPKDKESINLGIKLNIDWFALSFVRSAKDMNSILKFYDKENKYIPIVAKIEKPEAIDNLDSIIEEFNGVLIARGDLGVEMSLEKLPILQKKIIAKCKSQKKPVILATQLLESMISNSSPTRAEVNDVANAVYEEVDAVMLSGETAIGNYPVETVEIMSKIIKNVEIEVSKISSNKMKIVNDNDNRAAIGEAVKTISNHLKIDSIVVMTESGSTAQVVSHYRPQVTIFSLSPKEYICNRMSLIWGVVPIKTKDYLSTDDMILDAEKLLLEKKFMKVGQTFVLTAGVPVGISGSTNMLKIQKIVK
tara:strand:- start:3602 stop:5020 length:1419 start_codon:yes stop_codon:yes gene_type:complete